MARHKASKTATLDLSSIIRRELKDRVERWGGHLGTPSELEHLREPNNYVKTGIYGLDAILTGGKGLPCGRFIEVFAPESVGKSALTEFFMSRVKDSNGVIHHIDTEMTRDQSHLDCYGIGPDDFIAADLPDLESVWDYARALVEVLEKNKGDEFRPNMLVLDSLAATPSRAELNEKEHADSHVGLQARSNAKGCVGGEALTYLEDGRVKRIKDVQAGDRIMSMVKGGRIAWRTVKRQWSTGVNPTRLVCGLPVTDDHPIAVYRGKTVEYVRADALIESDVVAKPRVVVPPSTGIIDGLTERSAWLIGLVAGDGTWKRVGGSSLCAADVGIQAFAKSVLKDFSCYLSKNCEWPPKFVFSKESGKYNKWRSFLNSVGVCCDSGRAKALPSSIVCSEDSIVAAALAGLIDADGSVSSHNAAVSYSSVSPSLAHQVVLMSLRFGAVPGVYEADTPCHHYRMQWCGDNARRLLSHIRPHLRSKKFKDSAWVTIPSNGRGVCSDFMPVSVSNRVKEDLTAEQVRSVIPSKWRSTSYPEWGNKGRVRLRRSVLRNLGAAHGIHWMEEEADSHVWWEPVVLGQSTPMETFDIEMEWDDSDGEPNFLAGGIFVHNCRTTVRQFSASDAIFVFVNQIRDKIGAMGYGPKTDTPGGRALKFAYSIRLKLAKVKTLKKGDTATGHLIEVQAVKNKHAPPLIKTTVVLSYRRGIDVNASNLLFLQEHKYIIPAGGRGLKWRGTNDTFDKKTFPQWAEDNQDKVAEAVEEITAAMLRSGEEQSSGSEESDETED